MKNTNVFLTGVATVAQSIIRSLQDGKLNLTDLGNFFDDLGPVQDAIEATAHLPKELKSLKIEDIQGIVDTVIEKLEADLNDEALYVLESYLHSILVTIVIANK